MQCGSGAAIGVVVVPSMPMLRVINTAWLVSSQGEAGAEPGIAAVGLMSMPMPRTTFVRGGLLGLLALKAFRCDHAGQSQNCSAEREFVRGRTARVQEKVHQFQHLVVSRLEHSNSCANMVNVPSTQGAVTLLWNP